MICYAKYVLIVTLQNFSLEQEHMRFTEAWLLLHLIKKEKFSLVQLILHQYRTYGSLMLLTTFLDPFAAPKVQMGHMANTYDHEAYLLYRIPPAMRPWIMASFRRLDRKLSRTALEWNNLSKVLDRSDCHLENFNRSINWSTPIAKASDINHHS